MRHVVVSSCHLAGLRSWEVPPVQNVSPSAKLRRLRLRTSSLAKKILHRRYAQTSLDALLKSAHTKISRTDFRAAESRYMNLILFSEFDSDFGKSLNCSLHSCIGFFISECSFGRSHSDIESHTLHIFGNL